MALQRREFRLRDALQPLRDGNAAFTYVLIDCPPSLGLLTLNALVAADSVLVPLQCEFFALEGISHLSAPSRRCRRGLNPSLRPAGNRADHVRPPQQPLRPRRRRRPRLFRRHASMRRSSPATSASPRRRATASRCSSTICARPDPRPMSAWPPKCCAASAGARAGAPGPRSQPAPRPRPRRPAGGDGSRGSRRPGAPARCPRPARTRPVPAARRHANRSVAELTASIRGQGILQPCSSGHTLTARPLPDHRRRAPLARRPGRPGCTRSRCSPRLSDADAMAAALVENLQRAGPQPDGGGRGLPAADRRVRAHPGAARRRGRQVAQPRREHAAPAHRPAAVQQQVSGARSPPGTPARC